MPELSARVIFPGVVRTLGTGPDYRQAAAGMFTGIQGAESFTLQTDAIVSYDPGSGYTSLTLFANSLAVIYGTLSTALDNLHTAYVLFALPRLNVVFAARQQDYPAIQAITTTIPLWDLRGRTWKRRQLLKSSTPPAPPIEIITSGDGGSSFVRTFFASTFVMHLHFFAGTYTISMYWFNFGATGSIPHRPDTNASTTNNVPEENSLGYFSAIYPPSGTSWTFTNFAPHDTDGDNWPLPGSYADMVAAGNNFNGRVDMWRALIIAWWPFWRAAAQGLIDDNGHFDATNTWDSGSISTPPDPVGFLDSNVFDPANPTIVPGTEPATIAEDVLIRGNLSAVAVPTGATMTGITYFQHVDDHSAVDFAFFNDVQFFYPGVGPGALLAGDWPPGAIPVDVSSQFAPFGGPIPLNIPGNNLYSMLATGEYQDPTNGNHRKASAYVDFAIGFTTVNHYVDAPSGWQTGGGGEFVSDPLVPAPAWFLGVTQGADLGNVGADGRAYFLSNPFTVPGSFSSVMLKISAETGIGAIYINNTLLVTRDETIDLWDSATTLTFIVPVGYFMGGTNTLAAQCYSATGPCAVFFSLSFYA